MANETEHDHATPASEEDWERIERALDELQPGLDALQRTAALRRALPAALARAAAELAELRERAGARFPSGWLKALSRKGLEQSTRERVALVRARRIAELAPGRVVFDATCGLGADARAVSELGIPVLAADLDPVTAARARRNLAEGRAPALVLRADARHPPVREGLFLLLDPDRRATGPRALDPERWSPPWSALRTLCARFCGACVKLAPAFDIGGLGGGWPAGEPHLWQWVSDRGELCETNLWTGLGAGAARGEREAVVLAGDGSLHRIAARPAPVVSRVSEKVAGNFWLVDPDPAVVRAGLVGNLAEELGLVGLDPQLAYLAASEPPRTALARAWRVLEVVPADPKRVREVLRRHDFGAVEVRKRGHPDPTEVLARRFRGPGTRRGLVAVARTAHGHLALILDPGSGRVGDEGIEPPTSSL